MPEIEAPRPRLSRVTTRRGTLRQLNCPLDPELLVAEFSDELPPDVATAVREHMAVCPICGKRAQELHLPYALLASLGSTPAPYVPDLRESVRLKSARVERFLRPLRALGSVSRFGLVVTALAVVTLVALLAGVASLARSLNLLSVQRTTNQLQHVPQAAASGSLVAETDKLVSVTGADGQIWQVAEVIVVDQKSGQVTRSLPDSNTALRVAGASSLPVAVVADRQMVYELTGSQNGGNQALIGINLAAGSARWAVPLTLPNGDALPAGESATSLALAPNGLTVYVGLSGENGSLSADRALAVATSGGKVTAAITVKTPDQIPLPPPPGSLPASAFPSVVPIVPISGMSQTLASNGAIVMSPDGQALFDVVLASDASGVRYAIVRRVALQSGVVTVLGLPGSFQTTRLAASMSANAPQVYLVTGSPSATVYVLDAALTGPTLAGQITLGGPTVPASTQLNDTLSVNPAANGVWLYVTQDASAGDGSITAHSRWLVDTQGMGLVASVTDPTSAGALLGNVAEPHGKTFSLIGGQIGIGASNLSGGWTPWLQTNDSTPITDLIGTLP
ncbi:MAG TPA: hypothetical protein VF808_20035 [Ktedonobacterales bacterium]